MAKQITDDEDKLKRQARRRLIGAVALTTAIVVVLPMVLDSEPKPVGQDIELRIPDKDKVGAFAPKIDLPVASAPVVAMPIPSSAVSAPVVASTPAAQVQVVPATAVATVASVIPDIKPVSSPAKSVTTASEHKPEHAKQQGTAHTEQGQPVPKSGFVVQIGAFSNAETAHSWQKNLIRQGFKAYTEKLGDKTRVRIGPYSTRDAASLARHKLEVKGLHSNVVELD
ncbi:MAG: SPOR domain-containing protein [Nitrosomonadales bacterium]